MDNMVNNENIELEELRNDYVSAKENFANEQITNAEAIDKSIRFGLDELKLAKRRWLLLSCGGMATFVGALVLIYQKISSITLLVSTGIIILLYAATALLCNTSRFDGFYKKDSTTFINYVRRHQKLQYGFIRIYLVAFFFWMGFMITTLIVKLDTTSEKIAYLAFLLPFLGFSLYGTIRIHNRVISAYEGLLFDDPQKRKALSETYYSEEAIKERNHKSAKRKYATCLVMIFVMAALFAWEGIRTLKGVGIATTLPIYLIFIVVFIFLAKANKKDMQK